MLRITRKSIWVSILLFVLFLLSITVIHAVWYGTLPSLQLALIYLVLGILGSLSALLSLTRLGIAFLSGLATGFFVDCTIAFILRQPRTFLPSPYHFAIALLGLIIGIVGEVLHRRWIRR